MADRGSLSLADPVTRYLPDFRPALPDGSVPVITLEHLLTHTAGLTGAVPLDEDEKRDPRLQALDFDLALLPLEDAVMRLLRVPLLFAPGTGWSYSWGIDVLGAVAARITGGSLGDVVETYVTGPLGMKDTRFSLTDPARLAAAYADGADAPVLMGDPHAVPSPWGGVTTYYPGRIFDPKVFHSGGGGMAGTARDFMVLLETLRTGGGEIVELGTVAEGVRNRLPSGVVAQRPGWGFGHFGAVLTDPASAGSPQSPGTYRWGGIYGHTWFIDPAEKLSVVAMTNTGLEGCDGQFPLDVRDAIYGVARSGAAV
jgi:CubicO group peptidase (beta-lactamase class C family)